MVHSWGSTVNKRPSYRMSALEIKLIFDPSSGIPLAIFFFLLFQFNSRNFNFTLPPLKNLLRFFPNTIFSLFLTLSRENLSFMGFRFVGKKKLIKNQNGNLESSTIFSSQNFLCSEPPRLANKMDESRGRGRSRDEKES